MRICILSAFEDSVNYASGYSVRIVNLAKGLKLKQNNVNIILPGYFPKKQKIDGIPVYEMNGFISESLMKVIGKITKILKPTALYFFDPMFILRTTKLASKSDIIQIEQPVLCLLLSFFIRRTLKKPVAIDCHDVFQGIRLKHNSLIRRSVETALEKTALKNADLLVTVSKKEKEILVSMGFSGKKIIVAPNGVDTTSFGKQSNTLETRNRYRLGDARIVVFMGNFTYTPNLQALKLIDSLIAPKVIEKKSNVKFVVVGKVEKELESPDIIYTGYVERVADVLGIAHIGIAPLLEGAGTRLKILEYLSSGLPVVSTSVGAEGLEIKNGTNIIIEDSIEKFPDHIVQLLSNDELSSHLSASGKEVALNYDWKKITDGLEEDYQCFLSNSQSIK